MEDLIATKDEELTKLTSKDMLRDQLVKASEINELKEENEKLKESGGGSRPRWNIPNLRRKSSN